MIYIKYIICVLLFLMCGEAEADGQKRQGTSVAKATEDSLRSSSSTLSINDVKDEVRGYIFRSTELEDSLGLYIIDSVADVKELLKQCWKRLKKDFKQTHSRRQYLFTLINTPAGLTASQTLTIENDDGIQFNPERKIIKEWGPLHAEAPQLLSPKDSSIINSCMCSDYDRKIFQHLEYSRNVIYEYSRSWFARSGLLLSYATPPPLCLIELYDIDAYSIRNDAGEGIYRIDLVQKKVNAKDTEWDYSYPAHMIRLDFDMNTLRLLHQKGGIVYGEKGVAYYKHDYGIENDSPILKQFQLLEVSIQSHKVRQGITIRLMENE